MDPEWAESGRKIWKHETESWKPGVLSLDWKFMNELPMDELSRTYEWYELILSLEAADLYDNYRNDLLRNLKDQLNWAESGDWETAAFIPELNKIAPGFQNWVNDLENGNISTDH